MILSEHPLIRQNQHIQICSVDDLSEITFIEKESFGPDAWHPSFILVCLKNSHFPGIFINGKLAGYGSCRARGKLLHIDNLAINPYHRRQGLATSLFVHMVNWGISENCTEGVLQVEINNIQAIRIYQKADFRIITKLRSYYHRRGAPNGDAFLMRGKLDSGAAEKMLEKISQYSSE